MPRRWCLVFIRYHTFTPDTKHRHFHITNPEWPSQDCNLYCTAGISYDQGCGHPQWAPLGHAQQPTRQRMSLWPSGQCSLPVTLRQTRLIIPFTSEGPMAPGHAGLLSAEPELAQMLRSSASETENFSLLQLFQRYFNLKYVDIMEN